MLLAPFLLAVFRKIRPPQMVEAAHLRVTAASQANVLESSPALSEIEPIAEAQLDDDLRTAPVRR